MYITKYYVGFRTGSKRRAYVEERNTNGGWLLLGPGKKIEDLDDPKGLCQDKPHGPGSPTRVDLTNAGQLSDVLDLLAQC